MLCGLMGAAVATDSVIADSTEGEIDWPNDATLDVIETSDTTATLTWPEATPASEVDSYLVAISAVEQEESEPIGVLIQRDDDGEFTIFSGRNADSGGQTVQDSDRELPGSQATISLDDGVLTLETGDLLSPETTYKFEVIALVGDDLENPEAVTDPLEATAATVESVDIEWPDEATIDVNEITDQTATLTWNEAVPAENVEFYYLNIYEDGEDVVVATQTFERDGSGGFIFGDGDLTIDDGEITYETGSILSPETTYRFDVIAQQGEEFIDPLSTTDTTAELGPPEWNDNVGAVVTETGEQTATVEVDDYPISFEFFDEVVFSDATGVPIDATATGSSGLEYELAGLVADMEQDIYLNVRNTEGVESDDGPTITVTTDEVVEPRNFVAEATQTTVTLTWDGLNSGTYHISRNGTLVASLDTDVTDDLSYSESGLDPEHLYEYSVTREVGSATSTATTDTVRTGIVSATNRVSLDEDGSPTPREEAWEAELSGNGQYMVYSSGQTENLFERIYRHDLRSGARVTITPPGGENQWSSYETPFVNPTVSADGRYVAFASQFGSGQVFLKDVETGDVELISGVKDDDEWIEASGASANPSLSADGRYVAFESTADNLVESVSGVNVFVYDRHNREMIAIEAGHSSTGISPSLSPDGGYIVFESDNSDLADLPHDLPDGQTNIFRYDIESEEITWISQPSDGSVPNGDSVEPAISENGDHVVFRSDGELTDRELGDGIYLYDYASGSLELLNFDDGRTLTTRAPAITPDGRYVTFDTYRVDTQRNLVSDFGYNNTGARWERSFDGEVPAVRDSSISDDGSTIGFRIDIWTTGSTNLVRDDDNNADAFVTYLGNESLTHVPEWPIGSDDLEIEPAADWVDVHIPDAIPDAKYHAIYELYEGAPFVQGYGNATAVRADDLYPERTIDFQLEAMNRYGIRTDDRLNFTVTTEALDPPELKYTAYDRALVINWDHPSNGQGYWYDLYRVEDNGSRTHVEHSSLSSPTETQSEHIAVDSGLAPETTYQYELEFVDYLETPVNTTITATTLPAGVGVETEQMNLGQNGQPVDDEARYPVINAEGDVVAFESRNGPLVDGLSEDDNNWHSYVRDNGETELVSVNSSGAPANAHSRDVDISDDGNVVVFQSRATNLDPRISETPDRDQLYLHNRVTGETRLVSYGTEGEADSWVVDPSISGDGAYIAFASRANNLTPDEEAIDQYHVYVYDVDADEIELVTTPVDGDVPDSGSRNPVINSNGQFIVFESGAQNLVEETVPSQDDIFLWDREATSGNGIEHLSTRPDSDRRSYLDPSISDDGRYVVFHRQSNWVGGLELRYLSNGIERLDRETGELTLVSENPAIDTTDSNPRFPVISGNGQFVAWHSDDNTLYPVDGGSGSSSSNQVYVRNIGTGELTMVSVSSDGQPNDGLGTHRPTINEDGTYVAYDSRSDLLTPDADGTRNIFRTYLTHTLEPPAWPSDAELSVEATGHTFAVLSWPSALNDVSDYRVLVDGSMVATVSADQHSYIVEGLAPDTTYTLGIEAVGSDESTTPIETTTLTRVDEPGEAGLYATATSGETVDLFWDPVPETGEATGFSVQRQGDDGWETIADVDDRTETMVTDVGLAADTTYEYRVRTIDNEGQSEPHTVTATVTTASLRIDDLSWFVSDQQRFGYVEQGGSIVLTVVGSAEQDVTVEATYTSWLNEDGEVLNEPRIAATEFELSEQEAGVYRDDSVSLPENAGGLTALTATMSDGETTITEVETGINLEVFGSLVVDVSTIEEATLSDLPDNTRVQVWSDTIQDGASIRFDGEGTYTVDNLPAVNASGLEDHQDGYRVRLRAGGTPLPEVDNVSIKAGVVNPVDSEAISLTYEGPTELFAQVTEDAGFEGNIRITAYDTATGTRLGSEFTDGSEPVQLFSSDWSERHQTTSELRLVIESPFPGVDDTVEIVELELGTQTVDVPLPEPAEQPTVSGVVRDQFGDPVEGIDVISTQTVNQARIDFVNTATTDNQGRYELNLVPLDATLSASKQDGANTRTQTDDYSISPEVGDEMTVDLDATAFARYEFRIGNISYALPGGNVQTFSNVGGSEAEAFSFTVTGDNISETRASRSWGGYPIEQWLPLGEGDGSDVELSISGSPLGLGTLTETASLSPDQSVIAPSFDYPEDAVSGVVTGTIRRPDGVEWQRNNELRTTPPRVQIHDEDGSRVGTERSSGFEINLQEPGTYRLTVTGSHNGTEHFSERTFTLDDESASKDLGDIQMLPGGRFGFQDGTTLTADPVEITEGGYTTIRATYENTGPGSVTDAELHVDIPEHMTLVDGSARLDADRVTATADGQQVTVELGDVDAGETGVVRFQTTVGEILDPRDDELTATITFDDGQSQEEWLGSAQFEIGGVSMDVPKVVQDRDVELQGRAPGESQVRVFVGGTALGEADVAPNGHWAMTVTLPDGDPPVWHRLQAQATFDGEKQSSPMYNVRYDPEEPRLQSVTMWQGDDEEDVESLPSIALGNIDRFLPATSDPITFSTDGGVARFPRTMLAGLPFLFELEFSDPTRVSDVEVFIEGPAGGYTEASYDSSIGADGAWTASMETDRRATWSAGKIYVNYQTDTIAPPGLVQDTTVGEEARTLITNPIDPDDGGWQQEEVVLFGEDDASVQTTSSIDSTSSLSISTDESDGLNLKPSNSTSPGPSWQAEEDVHFISGGIDGQIQMEISAGHELITDSQESIYTGYVGTTLSGESSAASDTAVPTDSIFSDAVIDVRQPKSDRLAVTVSGEIPVEEFLELDSEPENAPEWDKQADIEAIEMNSSGENVTLVWHPAQDSLWVDEYRIYRVDDQENTLIGSVFGDTFEAEVQGLEPDQEYGFRVEAVNPHGLESEGGPTVTVTAGDTDSLVSMSQSSEFMLLSEDLAEPMWQAELRTASSGGGAVQTATRVFGDLGTGMDIIGVGLDISEAGNDDDQFQQMIEDWPEECAGPMPPEVRAAMDDATMMSVANVGTGSAFIVAGGLAASTGVGAPAGAALAAIGTGTTLAVSHQRSRMHDEAHRLYDEALEEALEEELCKPGDMPPGSDSPPSGTSPVADPAWKIDPSGFVYEVTEDNVVEDVTATVLQWDEEQERWEEWDAEWWGEENPQTTDAGGMYGWDVPPGEWRVVYEKDGYETAYSQDHYEDPIEVPPPHFDVNVPIRSLEPPEVTDVQPTADRSGINITFNRHVMKSTSSSNTVQVRTADGQLIDGTIEFAETAVNPHTDSEAETLARTVQFVPDTSLDVGTYELRVRDLVESYASVPLAEEYVTEVDVAEATVSELTIEPTELALNVGGQSSLTVTASFDNGTTMDVTDRVTWQTTVEDVVSIEDDLVTAIGEGDTEISATYKDVDSNVLSVESSDDSGSDIPSPGPGSGGDQPSPTPSPPVTDDDKSKTDDAPVDDHWDEDGVKDEADNDEVKEEVGDEETVTHTEVDSESDEAIHDAYETPEPDVPTDSEPDETPEEVDDDSIPGFGFLVVVMTLLISSVALRLRTENPR